jgi:ADP-dependent NAD(P)H-hydrate dehydratase / NAD(P)H-hydrate epimerase
MQNPMCKFPVYNSRQFGEWDRYTISKRYTSGLELMEKACTVFANWFLQKFPDRNIPLVFLCGKGNNGGDALGIARILAYEGYEKIDIWYLEADQAHCSQDFMSNWNRLPNINPISRSAIDSVSLPGLFENAILIDGLFGTGIRFPLSEYYRSIINQVNQTKFSKVIAIDLPSGLDPDLLQQASDVITADYTFTFQQAKRSFLFEENGQYCGEVHCGDIELDDSYSPEIEPVECFIKAPSIKHLIKTPDKFTHKHRRGSVCVLAGSLKYPGAALLVSRSAYKTGSGLVYLLDNGALNSGYLHTTPEIIPVSYEAIFQNAQKGQYGDTFIIGSGLDRTADARDLVKWSSENTCNFQLVMDADALNIIAESKLVIPPGTIITPHAGEFDRLFGNHENSFDRLETATKMAIKYSIIIVLKGPYTRVIDTEGRVYFNTSGNAGLSKAGTGDVLAGIIGSLLGQNYPAIIAAIAGVYIHGLAADLAVRSGIHPISLMASDVIEFISGAYHSLDSLDC